MNQESIREFITKLCPEANFPASKQFNEAIIPANKLHEVALTLKESAETHFDFLFNQTGVDIKNELGVVYHLRSTKSGDTIVLKTFTADRENPVVDSVCDIWRGAEYFEREIYDLLGIRFTNHPDLRRLFLEDDFAGFPLRKDFVDEINIVQK